LKSIKKYKSIPKICLVSSSGGHWEQLQRLKPLLEQYEGFFVSEKTMFSCSAKYLLKQTDLKDKQMIPKLLSNMMKACIIWRKEKPDLIITTGTLAALPFYLLARLFRKKFIFIETFSRIYDGTKAGRLMYGHSDMFIIQWESLRSSYPNAVYGGSIY
jgi:UDP-N-acetylglucosamine:LPS N-acetylglucosamine transferase